MSEAVRISAEETRQKVAAGLALLVCAYADYAKFTQYHLEGAIPLSDLHAREGKLAKDQEIVFY
ncbi:MAG: ArsR family transcriptional regulator [Desulfobacterales bacterium SG8_35]|nr:MAG: ArsR family transcriptional regulator [Desulfobacterales bacterium SG8_35]